MGERRKFNPPFVRQWRKRAGLSQEQLAEKIGCSVALVSMVERGQRQYDQEFLEAAAVALSATPDMLLRINPEDEAFVDTAYDQLRRIPEADQKKALAILEAFAPSPKSAPERPEAKPSKRRPRGG